MVRFHRTVLFLNTMENFTNLSSTPETISPSQSEALTITLCIITILVIIITCVSYLIVIILIITDESLHTISDYFLASISVSQLAFGLAVLPNFISLFILLKSFSYTIMTFIVSLFIFVTSSLFMNLIAVAADIYFKIAKPLKYLSMVDTRTCLVIITTIWMLSFVGGMMVFLILTLQNQTSEVLNFADFMEKHENTMYVFFDACIAPSIFIATCFVIGLIRLSILQHYKIKDECRPDQLRDQRRERKILGSILFLSSFLICWIPIICACNVIVALKWHIRSVNIMTVVTCVSIVATNQTAFGVLIFVCRQEKYKTAMKQRLNTIKEKLGH